METWTTQLLLQESRHLRSSNAGSLTEMQVGPEDSLWQGHSPLPRYCSWPFSTWLGVVCHLSSPHLSSFLLVSKNCSSGQPDQLRTDLPMYSPRNKEVYWCLPYSPQSTATIPEPLHILLWNLRTFPCLCWPSTSHSSLSVLVTPLQ